MFSTFAISANEQETIYDNGEYISTDLGKIYYVTEGDGTPAILINGGPGAGHRVFLGWFSFLQEFGYKVVYFDEIGRGRSTRNISGKFSPQMTVNDIEAVRKHLKADKVTLIGHSYGGIPAVQYALQYPQHVKEVLMLNASYDRRSQQMNIDNVNHLIKTKYPETWEEIERLQALGIRSKEDRYADLIYSGPAAKELQFLDPKNRKKRTKYPSKDKRDRYNLNVYFDIMGDDPEIEITGTLKGIDVTQQLANFNIPTLVIGGRHDNLSTPELVYQFYKMLPEKTANLEMFEQSRHWPWVEEPEKFIQVVSDFIRKNQN